MNRIRRPSRSRNEALVSGSRRIRLGAIVAGLLIGLVAACSPRGSDRSESLVARLESQIPDVIARGNSPSMQVTVVHGDRLIWSRGFGENPRVDSVHMNGSVQKVFDAVAVLQLVERGLVDLDVDVGTYLPLELRHPGYPNKPVTVRMLLAHRSGLGAADHQFAWDTGSAFSPEYRPACPPDLLEMSLKQFVAASLTPEGSNHNERIWIAEPGTRYHYSLVAFPLLRSMVEQVTGQSFPDYMRQNIFDPLEMTNSSLKAEMFAGRHTVPHTRIDGENVELPVWNGRGYHMHTTAEDQARFMLALMNRGQTADFQLVRDETVELMQTRTTRHKVLFKSSPDMQRIGDSPGLNLFRSGWYGYGGSTPGYQCLWRYHPSKKIGYVILTNVNAILGGGDNYASARSEIYDVQDALVAVLDPTLAVRSRAGEIAFVGAITLAWAAVLVLLRRRKRARRSQT
jgi:CubicO group peptidase (beta-lactamase class C family)